MRDSASYTIIFHRYIRIYGRPELLPVQDGQKFRAYSAAADPVPIVDVPDFLVCPGAPLSFGPAKRRRLEG